MTQLFAIHQPNFFPWLGYFNKIKRVEDFVFFDTVQRPRGKSWLTRVKVLYNDQPKWLTIPINKTGRSIEFINESTIFEPAKTVQQLFNVLESYYRRHPHFNEVFDFLVTRRPETDLLSEFNEHYIIEISGRLGFDTRFHRASEKPSLVNSGLLGNDMILKTCEEFSIKSYLSGKGCLDFFEPALYAERGIEVEFQELDFKPYPQYGVAEFQAGLSILDALFNLGFEGTDAIL
jgi:hypothetical protein